MIFALVDLLGYVSAKDGAGGEGGRGWRLQVLRGRPRQRVHVDQFTGTGHVVHAQVVAGVHVVPRVGHLHRHQHTTARWLHRSLQLLVVCTHNKIF
jgi:hypothetical protein